MGLKKLPAPLKNININKTFEENKTFQRIFKFFGMDFTKIQLKCSNCTGSDFYLQDGLYFCEECGVQYENLFEMETEWHGNDQTNYMTKIGKDKSKKNKGDKA